MATPFIGTIKLFGGNFAVRGYVFCNGQLLSIDQNNAVFALIGTTYGGDGVNTFGIPNLQSRAAVGLGSGPGLATYAIGQTFGQETVTLTTAQMPAHNHLLASSASVGTGGAAGGVWAQANTNAFGSTGGGAAMNGAGVEATGGNQAHENRQPFLALNYLFAVEGIFPSRN